MFQNTYSFENSIFDSEELSLPYVEEEEGNEKKIRHASNDKIPLNCVKKYQWSLYPEMELLLLNMNLLLRTKTGVNYAQRPKIVRFILNTHLYKNYTIIPTKSQIFSKFNNLRTNTISYLHSKYKNLKNTFPKIQELIEEDIKKSEYGSAFFDPNISDGYLSKFLNKGEKEEEIEEQEEEEKKTVYGKFRIIKKERVKATERKNRRKILIKEEEIKKFKKENPFEWIENTNERDFTLLINGNTILNLSFESIKSLNYCMNQSTLTIARKMGSYLKDSISLFGIENFADKGWAFSFSDNTWLYLYDNGNSIKIEEIYIIDLYKTISFICSSRMHE